MPTSLTIILISSIYVLFFAFQGNLYHWRKFGGRWCPRTKDCHQELDQVREEKAWKKDEANILKNWNEEKTYTPSGEWDTSAFVDR